MYVLSTACTFKPMMYQLMFVKRIFENLHYFDKASIYVAAISSS
jgi:hypothetical protein